MGRGRSSVYIRKQGLWEGGMGAGEPLPGLLMGLGVPSSPH
jgi:hypothetical protein